MDPSALMMVVSPSGKFYLINYNTKEVAWSYIMRDTDKMYAALKEDSVSDYVDAIIDNRGSIHLGHYRSHPLPELIEWRSDSEFERYVKFYFGDDAVAESQEMSVDFYKTGKRISKKKAETVTSFFRIQKKKYQILTGEWQLKFSKYETSFHDDNFIYQVHVYHTRTLEAFRRLLSAMEVLNENISHDIWIEEVTLEEVIQIRGNINENDSNLFHGLFGGLFKVVVKSFPQSHVFSSNCRRIWQKNNSNHIQRFYGLKADHDSYYLAFEYCQHTLYDYSVITISESHPPPFEELKGIWRGLFLGLESLDQQGLCHGHLNPWSILVTSDYITKVSGLCNFQTFTAELAGKDLQDLRKLIIFCHSPRQHDICKENYAESPMDPTQMFSWAYEARDIVNRLHDQRQIGRVSSLAKVALHPWLWDKERRIDFIKDVSELLEMFLGRSDLDEALKSIRSDIFPNKDWQVNIPRGLMAAMIADGSYYDEKKPRDLVRFIRRILSHLPTILSWKSLKREDHKFLGTDKFAVELQFRTLFPALLIKVYTFVEDWVVPRESLAGLQKYYFV